MKLLISCPFWLSSVLAKELKILWYKPYDTFETWTYIDGDLETLYTCNIWSRVANKVYIVLAEKKVISFDQLYDLAKTVERSLYIPKFSHITTLANSKNSKIDSERTIQSIAQRAVFDKILWAERKWIDKPDAPKSEIMVNITDDHAQILINTSWEALYKRGYRSQIWAAPIKENTAAWLILLAGRRFKEVLMDPFCGSGTIAIEAAMIAKNIAPGLKRNFAFEYFKNHKKPLLDDLKKEAKSKIYPEDYHIYACDVDEEMIYMAKDNASNAWVKKSITFLIQDYHATDLPQEYGRIITNPPYGKRLKPEQLGALYETLIKQLEDGKIKGGFITDFADIEKMTTHDERKKNSLYNGGEKATFRRIQHNTPTPPPKEADNLPKISKREADLLK